MTTLTTIRRNRQIGVHRAREGTKILSALFEGTPHLKGDFDKRLNSI